MAAYSALSAPSPTSPTISKVEAAADMSAAPSVSKVGVMIGDLALLDATAQAELVRQGRVQPIELVDAAIERIERLNPILNAVITPLFDRARAQAASPALPAGPFRGVPLLLKDFLCHTAGDPYYEGMRFLRDLHWREQHDTFLAARFRAAGFVFVGKTNLPELAGPPITEPVAFGPTHNPWDLTRSPGGSSGGSAAAVAAGLVPVAHANDGFGSIRIPASDGGLVGLKPSRGRTSFGLPAFLACSAPSSSTSSRARFATPRRSWTPWPGRCRATSSSRRHRNVRTATRSALILAACASASSYTTHSWSFPSHPIASPPSRTLGACSRPSGMRSKSPFRPL